MDLNNNLILTDKSGNESTYTVLFTFDSKTIDKSYVIYTDFSKDNNNYTKVWYSSYQQNNFSKLEPVETKEEVKLIDDILSSLEQKMNIVFSK